MASKKNPSTNSFPAVLALGEGLNTPRETGKLTTGDVVAFIAEDERPLPGLLGLWDWRLCGKISRLLLEEHFVGRAGEQLLTMVSEPDGRFCRLFVFGLGKISALDKKQAQTIVEQSRLTLQKAGARDFKTIIPASYRQEELSGWFADILA